jgi:hypothetical protein
MGLFSDLKQKLKTNLIGEVIADFGSLPTDDHGGQLSLSLRRRPGRPPHLQLQWQSVRQTEHKQIACSAEWIQQFERVAEEMRKHCGKDQTS